MVVSVIFLYSPYELSSDSYSHISRGLLTGLIDVKRPSVYINFQLDDRIWI